MENGATCVQYSAVANDMKFEWCFKRQAFGYEIRNRASLKAVDATQSGGNDVLTWDFGDGLHQQWGLIYTKEVNSGATTAPTSTPLTASPTVAPETTAPTPFPTIPPVTLAPSTFEVTSSPTTMPVTAAPTPTPTTTPIMPTTAAPTNAPTNSPSLPPVSSGPTVYSVPQECYDLPVGKYFRILNGKSGLPLIAEGTGVGANVLQGTIDAIGADACWRFELTSDHHYSVINESSGLVLGGKFSCAHAGSKRVPFLKESSCLALQWRQCCTVSKCGK